MTCADLYIHWTDLKEESFLGAPEMVESFDEQGLELSEEQEAAADLVVVRHAEARLCGGFTDWNGGHRLYRRYTTNTNEVSFIH